MKKQLTILLLAIALAHPAATARTQPAKQALLVYDAPYSLGGVEYNNLRDALSKLGIKYTYRTAWDIRYMLSQGILEEWVTGRVYSLVIVNWAREPYREAVTRLVKICAENGIPVLFLPPVPTDLLKPFGLQMTPTHITNQTFSVAEHNITAGIYVVAAVNYAVIAAFKPATVQAGTAAQWTPIVLNGTKAIAVAGRIGNAPAAAIAPFLYADPAYDNNKLLENTIRWLLGIPLEQEEARWTPAPIKNLTATIQQLQQRKQLLEEEVQQLQQLRDQLQNQTNQLKAQLQLLENTTKQLAACKNTTKQLQNQLQQAQQRLKQLEAQAEQARQAYRALGLAAAAGIAAGAAIHHIHTKKKQAKPRTTANSPQQPPPNQQNNH